MSDPSTNHTAASDDTTDVHDRRAELLGAAATDDLSASERHELQRLAGDDPGVRAELEELLAMVAALPPRGSDYDDTPPSDDLVGRVRALAPAEPPAASTVLPADLGPDTYARHAGGRRPVRVLAAFGLAAALLVIGGVAGAGLQARLAEEPTAAAATPSPSASTPAVTASPSATPTGPPGTLGAPEAITFTVKPSAVAVTATVTAHTWGTETTLTVSGLRAGGRYELVVVERDGNDQQAGAFIGTTKTVVCHMNAAVLRPDVKTIEVRNAGGETLMSSTLPTVRT